MTVHIKGVDICGIEVSALSVVGNYAARLKPAQSFCRASVLDKAVVCVRARMSAVYCGEKLNLRCQALQGVAFADKVSMKSNLTAVRENLAVILFVINECVTLIVRHCVYVIGKAKL